MTPRKIAIFKEAVIATDRKFECDQRDLKKLTIEQLSTMWFTLLEREAAENKHFDCVQSHSIGEWVGISLVYSDEPSIGISESIQCA